MQIKFRSVAFLVLISTGCAAVRTSETAVPTSTGGRYSIRVDNVEMKIDPAIGGRITEFLIDGENFFTGSAVNSFNWGSTFWFSPQRDWNWPPSAEIDNKPYSAVQTGREIMMTSSPDPKTGLVVTKSFSGNIRNSSFILNYTIINRSDSIRKVAPWEVSRVKPGGIAFFPIGEGERTGGLVPSTIEKNGVSWFIYQEAKLPPRGVNRQLYSDGREGWMAQVNGNVIMIKKFPDISIREVAPEEGEVELFASNPTPGRAYVEIEHQGPYRALKPGQSLTWKVEWFLRTLPSNIIAEAGNPELLAFVRQIVR